MAMMRVDHPDILDFIRCKKQEGQIRNFNITVTMTDEFMEQLQENPDQLWYGTFKGEKCKPQNVLRYPNGAVKGSEEIDITVGELYNELVESAWNNGEPGIAFIDTVNKTNPLPGLGPVASSNPCGEQFLHPYDNCNLGSINLERFVKDGEIDWERLRFVTVAATRMLDNVIDLFEFPIPQVTELALKNRRVGLGIMGFGDMLYQLDIPYNSVKGVELAEKVMGFIQAVSHEASEKLGEEKGSFPNYDKSIFAESGRKRRNAALTTVAPTGSISMMFDVSSGIEPIFALAYVMQDKDGQQYRYFNRYFEKALDELQLSQEEKNGIMEEVIEKGSIQHLESLPKELRDVFVVAMDISGGDHMKMQAAFQRHVDNSISKTINFPNSATKEDIAKSFISAWKLGCKSSTVYRDGSRVIQVLNIGNGDNVVSITEDPTKQLEKTSVQNKTEKIEENPVEEKIEKKGSGIVPRERPDVMTGKTYRMKTGYGNLYVTVNNDEKGVPFEIFATIGKSGGFFQEQSEAICRMVSLSLRSGIDVKEVVDNLKGIRGPSPILTGKGMVLSLPDAVGQILEEHVTTTSKIQEVIERPENQEVLPFEQKDQSIADYGFMPGCPECGSPLAMSEGCISCKSCGFSRCG
ncbi:MAG TPA: adenosylcobalamin-dependent ribonucleoside-diphosphate reductase [candidate division CPR3 bacterium]|uniref:Vitamin B12-dependent ribonucleotide reductase n=1 Tax=candidate division CPR3 bacterium TaxID=2268181 RepID=A0A7C1SUT9_UNCC3|nr:adenosylcobalamin-dependent ribonucleoside-diphosphate reductase [candidate division CPR3 bacterium]